MSRARIPLTLNPRKKGFTRIPPTLADTTSRPAGHASRRRTHWRNEQGADARNKTHKKKSTKNMKDNQQTHLKGTSQSLHYTTQRTHARLFFGERRRLSPLVPTAIGRVLVRVRVRMPGALRSRSFWLQDCSWAQLFRASRTHYNQKVSWLTPPPGSETSRTAAFHHSRSAPLCCGLLALSLSLPSASTLALLLVWRLF